VGTTILMKQGPRTEVDDPGAVPYPEGPVWDRIGLELVCGCEPAEIAEEYGEDPAEVRRLSELFWGGYSRARWLTEADEYGILGRLVALPNDELYETLLVERRRRNSDD